MIVAKIVIIGLLCCMVGMFAYMAYGTQVVAVKSCTVTSTYVPFGASHVNARGTCDDGTSFDAVWQLKVGCEPRVGDHVTVSFYRALWLPQLTGDASC